MSLALILAIFWATLFTPRTRGYLLNDDNDPLPLHGPQGLVQPSDDDVIKGTLRERARLEGEGVCACPEKNFCENLKCLNGIVCLNPEYVGLVTVAASVGLLFVILSTCLIAVYCTVRNPCGNLCPCCCGTREDRPDNNRRRQRQLSVRETLEEVVSIGGSSNDSRGATTSGRTSSPRNGARNCSDGKNASPGLQFTSPVPERQGGADKSPEGGMGSDKKRKRKSVSSDEGDDEDVRQDGSDPSTSENETDDVRDYSTWPLDPTPELQNASFISMTTSQLPESRELTGPCNSPESEVEESADETRSADLTFGDSTANDSAQLIKN